MLILWNKDFHEFVLTILVRPLFNTLMDLSYSAFASKLFNSNDSLILRSCMLDNFASVFEQSKDCHGDLIGYTQKRLYCNFLYMLVQKHCAVTFSLKTSSAKVCIINSFFKDHILHVFKRVSYVVMKNVSGWNSHLYGHIWRADQECISSGLFSAYFPLFYVH